MSVKKIWTAPSLWPQTASSLVSAPWWASLHRICSRFRQVSHLFLEQREPRRVRECSLPWLNLYFLQTLWKSFLFLLVRDNICNDWNVWQLLVYNAKAASVRQRLSKKSHPPEKNVLPVHAGTEWLKVCVICVGVHAGRGLTPVNTFPPNKSSFTVWVKCLAS